MTRLVVKQPPSPGPGAARRAAESPDRSKDEPRAARGGEAGAARAGISSSASQRAASNAAGYIDSQTWQGGYRSRPMEEGQAAASRNDIYSPIHCRPNGWDDEQEAGAPWNGAGENSGDEGVNSADEYDNCNNNHDNHSDHEGGKATERGKHCDEDELEEILWKAKRFRINRMKEDGNCMFSAISDQVYGDPGMHDDVRQMCMDYLSAERDHFSQFVTEDFDEYVLRKRKEKVFGNNLEMQAIAEILNRPIEVYTTSEEPIKIFHEGYQGSNPPIRLSYHRGNHYNSVVNPDEHTVGVGLGLPAYRSTYESEERIEEDFQKVILQSEQENVEDSMLETALNASREAFEESEIQMQLLQMSILESRTDAWSSWAGNSDRAAGAK